MPSSVYFTLTESSLECENVDPALQFFIKSLKSLFQFYEINASSGLVLLTVVPSIIQLFCCEKPAKQNLAGFVEQ